MATRSRSSRYSASESGVRPGRRTSSAAGAAALVPAIPAEATGTGSGDLPKADNRSSMAIARSSFALPCRFQVSGFRFHAGSSP